MGITQVVRALCASIEIYIVEYGKAPTATMLQTHESGSRAKVTAWSPRTWRAPAKGLLILCMLAMRDLRILAFQSQLDEGHQVSGAPVVVNSAALDDWTRRGQPITVLFPGDIAHPLP